MQTEIREIQANDIDEIMEIWLDENLSAHSFLSENFWKNNFEKAKKSIEKSKGFVIEENGNIQGFVALSGNYIEYLFVKKTSHRKGFGKKLIKQCKNSFWSLMIKVYEKNETALKFFENQSFFVRDKMVNAETEQEEICLEWIR